MLKKHYLPVALLVPASLVLASCGGETGSAGGESFDLKFASYNVPTAAEAVASKQWAKDGMPLYFFIKDKKMGDMTGDGMKKGEWNVAKP